MRTDSLLASAAVISVFVIFVAALAWVNVQSPGCIRRHPRGRASVVLSDSFRQPLDLMENSLRWCG